MKFTNKYNILVFKSFINKYGKDVDNLYPELNEVEIDVYDRDSAPLKKYIVDDEVWGDLSSNVDCTFQCYPKHISRGVQYNDIIMIETLCKQIGLTEKEMHALIAHEIGHFVSVYRNTGLNGQADEYYADKIAVELGFVKELKNALTKSLSLLPSDGQRNVIDRISKL